MNERLKLLSGEKPIALGPTNGQETLAQARLAKSSDTLIVISTTPTYVCFDVQDEGQTNS
jgi:hypothetical protein